MKIGVVTKEYEGLRLKEEVYEWLGETAIVAESFVAVTLKPKTLPYVMVPLDCLRWAGECEHFDIVKAEIDAHRKKRGW